MIPKSGYRFSEKIMLNSMIPKSGYRLSEKIMLKKQAKVKW
jgi:DNA-binding winged helix-turn-helix (wHTH) protein